MNIRYPIIRNKMGKPIKMHRFERIVKARKDSGTGFSGYFILPKFVQLPKELIGKRIRLVFEIIDETEKIKEKEKWKRKKMKE